MYEDLKIPEQLFGQLLNDQFVITKIEELPLEGIGKFCLFVHVEFVARPELLHLSMQLRYDLARFP
jgi:hypothetical protein